MSSNEVLERTFPGFEGAVPIGNADKTAIDKAELNKTFDEMCDVFHREADYELTGIIKNPTSGDNCLVIYDLVSDHEVIVLWGLNKRGATRKESTIFLNRTIHPDSAEVDFFSNVKFRGGIFPATKKFDGFGNSIPLNKVAEVTKNVVTPLLDGQLKDANPSEAL